MPPTGLTKASLLQRCDHAYRWDSHPSKEGTAPVIHDSLTDLDRTSLDRLKLAADVILGEGPNIPDPLTAELTIFRDRVERALLLPTHPMPSSHTGQ